MLYLPFTVKLQEIELISKWPNRKYRWAGIGIHRNRASRDSILIIWLAKTVILLDYRPIVNFDLKSECGRYKDRLHGKDFYNSCRDELMKI